jgi:hypothetical protein
MASGSETAPAWLFSFVDLAFLLLIALTQVGGGPRAVDLGEIVVPRVNEEAADSLPAGARERWQLRIHPPEAADPGPFELLAPGSAGTEGAHLATATLREQLGRLHEARTRNRARADDRSQDRSTRFRDRRAMAGWTTRGGVAVA